MRRKKFLLMLALLCTIVQGTWAQNFDVWDGKTYTKPSASFFKEGYNWDRLGTVEINTAAELAWLMNHFDDEDNKLEDKWYTYVACESNINLNADIDMTAGIWKKFSSYPTKAAHRFDYNVTFNGNGHTIRIRIDNGTSDNNQGLFEEITEYGTVKNLHVDCNIKVGNARLVAGIAGENNGTIENCWVSGHVESDHYSSYDADLGGIAGLNNNDGTIKYCCVTADIKNTDKNSGVGGIAGSNEGTIQHVTFTGSVSVEHDQDNKYVGDQDATLENYYDSYNQDEYLAASDYGMYRQAITSSFVANWPTQGAGTSGDPYIIGNATDWNNFANNVTHGIPYKDCYVKLTDNISVSSMAGSDDAYSFQGTFDGDGHTLTFNKSGWTEIYSAPFRYVGSASFRNLRVAGTINTTYQYAGGMIAYIVNGNTVSIENCRSSVTINSSQNTNGGFVSRLGDNATLTVSGCVFDGSFEGTGRANGGFVGYCQGGSSATFTNSLFKPDHISCDLTSCQTFWRGVDATITGCYYTETLGTAQGTAAIASDSFDPLSIGNLVKDYGMVKAYEHALLFDGKYYFDPATTTGSGTASAPFTISTADQWETFAASVNNGISNYSGKFVRLAADISVSEMVGTGEGNSFQGTFLGNGQTLTFTKGSAETAFGQENCAPFRFTKNATIRDLKVAGDIYTSRKFAAGLAARPYGTTTITNCAVSTNIYSSVSNSENNDGTHSGLLAMPGGTFSIEGCAYTGRLLTNNGTTNCGGFVGWSGDNTFTVTASLYAPGGSIPEGWSAINAGATFVRGNKSLTATTCYFTEPMGNAQGWLAGAFTSAPANLGDEVKNYGMVTAYDNGIYYGGKYYMAYNVISLYNDRDNGTAISTNDGSAAIVTLQDRTLYRDGAWNTLCLPFDVELSGSPLAGATARPLSSASISGSTLNLTFGSAVDKLEAGTPYIIKWDKADGYDEASEETRDLKNPVFSGVTISSAMHPYDSGEEDGDQRVRFLGTYASRSFDGEDKSILFMGGANTLYYPLSGATLGAHRAYFQIGEDGVQVSAARRVTAFNISFGGEENTTGILEVNGVNEVIGVNDNSWYSLDGRRLAQQPSRAGVYIYKGKKTVIK